ncbi:MAG: hypothetical protein JSR66_11885 [Proteobacteria bacterium]|nr:hypothetical protein [Pseudomonadota bacterium]
MTYFRHLTKWKAVSPLASLALLVSCGGDFNLSAPPAPAGSPLALMPQGVAVNKFRASGNGWVVMTERLLPLVDLTAPDRSLQLSTGNGPTLSVEPPQGWSLIDFALHPSGEVSLVLASDKQLRLQRLTRDGRLLGDMTFVDAEAAADPFIGSVTVEDSQSLVPLGTRDAVRLAPFGEGLLIAYRTGRNVIVAQLLSYIGGAGFEPLWRTIVEPGVPIFRVRLTSGTFDPFGSLDSQWHLLLDVDSRGQSAIAVSVGGTDLTRGHSEYFGEPLDPALVNGAIVTVLDGNGHRLNATPVDTRVLSEAHAVRWAGDTVVVAGRVRTAVRDDGSGWDGFVARVSPGKGATQMQALDFDRGDVILDVAPMSDGRIALAGSTAYLQNPTGASISESAEPLLAVLPAVSGPARRLPLPVGLRQNQVRTVAPWLQGWVIGGLQNGPGTHSADSNPALLTCDGFIRAQEF